MAAGLLPLTISVRRGSGAARAQADAAARTLEKKILERDQGMCRFCGFKAQNFQTVVRLESAADAAPDAPDAWATACTLCEMVLDIAPVGRAGKAVLAWIPEILQCDLHHLVRSAMVADRAAQAPAAGPGGRPELTRPGMGFRGAPPIDEGRQKAMALSDIGQGFRATLLTRQEEADKRLGTSDPKVYADVLAQMTDEQYARRADMLMGVRLLPTMATGDIGDQVDHWRDRVGRGAYANLDPSTWRTMLAGSPR